MTYEPIIPMVSAYSAWSSWTGTPSSGTWWQANGAIYAAVLVPTTCVARRMWWANGATVSASYNLEAAIYIATAAGDPGTLLVSTGSVAQGTASEVQFADITDTVLPPGVYWIMLTCSSASATTMRGAVPSVRWNELMILSETVAPGSAPATATPAEPGSGETLPLFGFATTASP